jgi:hypothetical protein
MLTQWQQQQLAWCIESPAGNADLAKERPRRLSPSADRCQWPAMLMHTVREPRGLAGRTCPLYTPEAFSLRAGPVRWTGVMKTDGTGV